MRAKRPFTPIKPGDVWASVDRVLLVLWRDEYPDRWSVLVLDGDPCLLGWRNHTPGTVVSGLPAYYVRKDAERIA